MRRLVPLLALSLAVASCAAPEIRLRARFAPGEIRDYRLVADAEVRISAARVSSVERTRLVATTRIEVADITAGTATLTLTITPRSLTRDGRPADPPPPQQIRMTVGPDGRVREVTTVGGQPTTLEAAEVEDLVPLIGPPLPEGRVHVADRWRRTPAGPEGTPAGTQDARLASLRVVGGYDCAVVALSTRRPVVRERDVAGSPLRLEGIEHAAGEIAFAFREGLPVTVRSNAEARLAISGGAAQGGAVVIATTTSLSLVNRTAPGL